MSAVTVPDDLTAALAAAAGPVELRAGDGRVLGDFVPRTAPAPDGYSHLIDPVTGKVPLTADIDPLTIPPRLRGPDLMMRAALEAIRARRAAGPQFTSPIRDEYLREARAGGMYGDLD